MNNKLLLTLALATVIGFVYGQQTVFIGDSGKANLAQYELDGTLITVIDDDVNTPRGITNDDNLLFYVNKDRGELIRYDLDFSLKTVIIDGLDDPTDVFSINEEDFLVVIERDGKISRIDYVGSNYLVLTTEINDPLRSCHDPVLEKIFITNRSELYTMDYDGSKVETIAGTFDDVIAIEADQRTETLYFAERGSTFNVSKMNYDGSNRQVIIDNALNFSYFDLACEENKMFFTASANNAFGSFDLDGSDLEIHDVQPTVLGGLDLSNNACDKSTSTIEHPKNNIRVYPNPTSGQLKISSDDLQLWKIEVYDLQGRVVQTIMNDSNSAIELDVNPGQYILKLYGAEKTIISRLTKVF